MGFFDNFFKPAKEEVTAASIIRDRENLKLKLSAALSKSGFTRMEIDEVIDIITLAEADIEFASKRLNGVHINNPDPTKIMHSVLEEIREYQNDMAEKIRKKISEIKERKKMLKRSSTGYFP